MNADLGETARLSRRLLGILRERGIGTSGDEPQVGAWIVLDPVVGSKPPRLEFLQDLRKKREPGLASQLQNKDFQPGDLMPLSAARPNAKRLEPLLVRRHSALSAPPLTLSIQTDSL